MTLKKLLHNIVFLSPNAENHKAVKYMFMCAQIFCCALCLPVCVLHYSIAHKLFSCLLLIVTAVALPWLLYFLAHFCIGLAEAIMISWRKVRDAWKDDAKPLPAIDDYFLSRHIYETNGELNGVNIALEDIHRKKEEERDAQERKAIELVRAELSEKAQTEMDELRRQHVEETKQLTEEHENRVSQLNVKFKEDMTQAVIEACRVVSEKERENTEIAVRSAEEELDRIHSEEIRRLKENQEEEIAQISLAFQEEEAHTVEKAKAELAEDLNSKHEKELAELRSRHEEEKSIAIEKARAEAANELLKEKEEAIRQTEKNLNSKHEEELALLKKSFEDELDSKNQKFEEEISQLQMVHEAELSTRLEENTVHVRQEVEAEYYHKMEEEADAEMLERERIAMERDNRAAGAKWGMVRSMNEDSPLCLMMEPKKCEEFAMRLIEVKLNIFNRQTRTPIILGKPDKQSTGATASYEIAAMFINVFSGEDRLNGKALGELMACWFPDVISKDTAASYLSYVNTNTKIRDGLKRVEKGEKKFLKIKTKILNAKDILDPIDYYSRLGRQ